MLIKKARMVDISKLKEEQLKLAGKVSIVDNIEKIKTIGGVEQIFYENKIISTIVVCDYKDFKFIESKYSIADVKIPYISGYLFYREGPAIMEAFNKLEHKPDVLLVKGNGILHARRIGMASHLGVLLDTPTIGVAKNLSLGEVKENTIYIDKEARGYKFISREHAKPIYISPGHKISLRMSMEIVKKSIKYPHKLPEPMHLAHKYANKVKKELKEN